MFKDMINESRLNEITLNCWGLPLHVEGLYVAKVNFPIAKLLTGLASYESLRKMPEKKNYRNFDFITKRTW